MMTRAKLMCGLLAALVLGAFFGPSASAQVTAVDLGSITLPVSATSIATQVATVGAAAVVAIAAIMIGFALVWKLIHRAKRAV